MPLYEPTQSTTIINEHPPSSPQSAVSVIDNKYLPFTELQMRAAFKLNKKLEPYGYTNLSRTPNGHAYARRPENSHDRKLIFSTHPNGHRATEDAIPPDVDWSIPMPPG